MLIEYDSIMNGIYERVGILLHLHLKILNLIGQNVPRAKKTDSLILMNILFIKIS
jgi:hypothetical protein